MKQTYLINEETRIQAADKMLDLLSDLNIRHATVFGIPKMLNWLEQFNVKV